MSSWGEYKTPCPNCGGTVEWWAFGSDDRYNQGSSGIRCKGQKCGREFTQREWEIIAKEELKPELEKREQVKSERESRKKEREALIKSALAKLTPEELEALTLAPDVPLSHWRKRKKAG